MAELTYWEITGPYTLCDGVWRNVEVVNPEPRAIQIKSVELALAIDNGTAGDIGLYVTRSSNGKALGVGSFTIQQPGQVEGIPLRQRVDFGADWMTVAQGEKLKLSFAGSPNAQPARSYIPVARMYYI